MNKLLGKERSSNEVVVRSGEESGWWKNLKWRQISMKSRFNQ